MKATALDKALIKLAQISGIQTSWLDKNEHLHSVSAETCRSLLSAIGFSDEITSNESSTLSTLLERWRQQKTTRWLEPIQVISESETEIPVLLHLPEYLHKQSFEWQLSLEDGQIRVGQFSPRGLRQIGYTRQSHRETSHKNGTAGPYIIGRYLLKLNENLPRGYHQFSVKELESGQTETLCLVITPLQCYQPEAIHPAQQNGLSQTETEPQHQTNGELLPSGSPGRIWGLSLDLPLVKSARNWGIGDFGDLLKIVDWCAEHGTDLIRLKSIHAELHPDAVRGLSAPISSRSYMNPLLIDVETIEDFAESDEARQLVFSATFQDDLNRLRQEAAINYAEVEARKLEVLHLLYQNFSRKHLANNTDRAQEFQAYAQAQGLSLERFALFHTLQEQFEQEDPKIRGSLNWPESYQSPDTPSVKEFLESNRERVGFYQYLQWQIHRQLQAVGLRCLSHNLGVGLCLEVAVGANAGGAECWSIRDERHTLYAENYHLGMPPDSMHIKGQDWILSPPIPDRMREENYHTFIEILRQNMQYNGALRLSQAWGLIRLFWIPPGKTPEQGAFIQYPADELLGILALESHRNQCLIIGDGEWESLPEHIQAKMEQFGVFSSQVFYNGQDGVDTAKMLFLRDNGELEESSSNATHAGYRPRDIAIALADTDLPTLVDFWEGRDVAQQIQRGFHSGQDFPSGPDLALSKAQRDFRVKSRALARIGILDLLERQGLLPAGVTIDPISAPRMTPELSAAVHRLMAQTAAKIFLVRLEDLFTGSADWSHFTASPDTPPLTLPLEAWWQDAGMSTLCEAIAIERPRYAVQAAGEPQAALPETKAPVLFSVPTATYRFQFNANFTFKDAEALIPYLSRLGISHCYASPLLSARSGSLHGYDITDHKQLNPEIGSLEEFQSFIDTLHAHSMSLIVDIVPNHMGAGKDNPWWMDVLENGRSSIYSDYFDIDWNPLVEDLNNKILLAILGDSYGKILENEELQLCFDPETARFWLAYHEHRVPMDPTSYPTILEHRIEVLETRLGHNYDAFLEYRSLISAFEHLPVETGNDFSKKEERTRERTIALNRLIQLCRQTPEILSFIEENLQAFQPKKEDTTSLLRLNRLLEQQNYRLANWRVASDEINYRRFFDINDLIALRAEDERVFRDTHELIMSLIEKGQINGVRIDHPDGLYDPAGYFRRLQMEAAHRLGVSDGTWKLNSPSLAFYVLIEKILAPFEKLPEEWAVHGTTGYEFTNLVNGLFVRQENEREFTRIYEKLTGRGIDFEDLLYRNKKLIMKTALNSELSILTYQLSRLSKANWSFRDFTLQNLRSALIEVVACFPVYRTYVTPDTSSKKDREYIGWAIQAAKRRSSITDTSVFDFIRLILLMEASQMNGDTAEFQAAVIRFAMKFQQYTGPVMAKGMEDTTFYQYNRLVSLNEVGGDPRQFGVSLSTFHYQNGERARRMPHTMLATSTHDAKRSEDVRARISVLSEMPEEWARHVGHWRRMNRNLRKTMENNHPAPSANDEYLFYQTLLGIWPLTQPTAEELETLADRVEQHMLKAVREAKAHSNWINPSTEYELALSQFVRGVMLRPSQLFMEDFLPFQKIIARFGMFNALSQTILKLTCPGVPDLYQGTELFEFSLVDPDNRRPVDYRERQDLLNRVREMLDTTDETIFRQELADMVNGMEDARIKQYVIAAVMDFRNREPALFKEGSYLPLNVTGIFSEHIIAFARCLDNRAAITVAPRQIYTMGLHKGGPLRKELPCGRKIWKDTTILIPDELKEFSFRNVLNREEPLSMEQSGFPVADILKNMPIAFLTGEPHRSVASPVE